MSNRNREFQSALDRYILDYRRTMLARRQPHPSPFARLSRLLAQIASTLARPAAATQLRE